MIFFTTFLLWFPSLSSCFTFFYYVLALISFTMFLLWFLSRIVCFDFFHSVLALISFTNFCISSLSKNRRIFFVLCVLFNDSSDNSRSPPAPIPTFSHCDLVVIIAWHFRSAGKIENEGNTAQNSHSHVTSHETTAI